MNSESYRDLLGEPRDALQKWIDDQVADFRRKLAPGDQVWFYREEKCDHCGWYREGYLGVRGCAVVAELNTLEDM